jgi:hypothetical protein
VVKWYPAGASTNSQDGMTDIFGKCLPVLEEMVKQEMPLLVRFCYIVYFSLLMNKNLTAFCVKLCLGACKIMFR